MPPKQLIVAVEGTAAVGPFWQTIVSEYLDKIIRCFCGNELTGQKTSNPGVELSLVMFSAHGSYSACLVQRSGWTRDMDIFFQWLSAIPFSGGGFNEAAIAEGLSEALMMLSSPNGSQNTNMDSQRHCILIAASNPNPLPTPVYRPQPHKPEQSDNTEIHPDDRLCNAETLAKSFAQCSVSLSVICPKQLPKLRSIYDAGKRNPRAVEPPVDNVKNPHFLVLISENFMEGRAALSRSGMTNIPSNQIPLKMDVTPVPSLSGPTPTSIPSANGSVLGRQSLSGGNITPAIVKVEPTTMTSTNGPAFPNVSSVPRAASQAVPILQTSSPMSASLEMIPNNENLPEMKPVVNNMTSSLRPVGGAAANVRILNDVAQARQGNIGGSPMLSNMISSGIASSVPPTQTVIPSGQSGVSSISGPMPTIVAGQVAQNSVHASFPSATSNVSGNSGFGMSQPLNLQGTVSMGQTLPGMSQGNHPGAQMIQNGMSMNQNVMNGNGAAVGISSGNSPMMSNPGMQNVAVNGNNSMANMAMNQQSANTVQSAQSKYIKVWEGNLSGQRQGQPVFITRLEGYRNSSASEALAANWPPVMQIVRLISQDHMNNKQYVGKADFLVFRAMNQHGFLGQLQEKKLCAVIQLPSQTLLLSVSDKAYRLIGMLFPGDMVVFKPQIPNGQQQQQMQAQHLQQLQQQQPLQQQMLQQQPPPIQQQQMQQQQPLQQMQPQQMQQQPVMQMQQPRPQLQQQPGMQMQQSQQMVGGATNQTYVQQGAGRSQMLSGQGQVSSQGLPSMSGGSFMS